MNKLMDINEACETIELFAEVNHLDPLSGIEVMVKYFKQLSLHERNALITFMEETKK